MTPSSTEDAKIIDLIEQLRQVQVKAEEVATPPRDLKQQLDTTLKKATELHQKTVEEQRDVGGEG
jgi:uncharacterized protein YoxC